MNIINAATVKEKIDSFLEQQRQDLILNYDKLGLRASGQWAKELEPQSVINQTDFKAIMLGMDYTYYLENGRGKTQNKGTGRTLKEIIREWIDVKGISPNGISKDSLAYLITRKIHREGIAVPNKFNSGGLVSDVITKEKAYTLINDIGWTMLSEIKSSILKQIKIGNN